MAINRVGRDIPESYYNQQLIPYHGPYDTNPEATIHIKKKQTRILPDESKRKNTLKEAILATGLKDGMTISFHHHFRSGDMIIGQVLTAIQELGIKGLTFAPSAIVNIKHTSILNFIKDGTITRIEASGIRGELGDAVLKGLVDIPIILRTHGGRPRAIESGELAIDVAFIGASAADDYGNATGCIGENACGSLGFAMIDARSAAHVVVITDNLVAYPCTPISISQHEVDYVVKVEQIGDSQLIGQGSARITKNPRDLRIAQMTAKVIAHSGVFQDGFSFQAGAGAISIACVNYLKEYMIEQNITASFCLGGVPAAIANLLEEGLVKTVLAVQSFDADAARAMTNSPHMIEYDNGAYANPHNKGCALNKLDVGILGALEIDLDFNVNILTGSSGEMLGGLGGGPDVAAGARISILTIPLIRGRTPSIVKKVLTLCTPGETVAILVTEAGIALNPNHPEYEFLKVNLKASGIPLYTIEELHQLAISMTGEPEPIPCSDKVVAVVQYRDGTVIDVIREIKIEE